MSRKVVIASIVEGHGEFNAVPMLIRRIGQSLPHPIYPETPNPIRVPRDRLLKEAELERAIELAANRVDSYGGVLVLLDADDDCPARRGPELLARARTARTDVPIAVVLAKREFEGWFLASAASLRAKRGLPADLAPPVDPESVRGAKEWLSKHLPHGQRYVETSDQVALTALFDLDLARTADSFDKCYREVVRLLHAGRA